MPIPAVLSPHSSVQAGEPTIAQQILGLETFAAPLLQLLKGGHDSTARNRDEVDRTYSLAGFQPVSSQQLAQFKAIAKSPQWISKFLGVDAKTYSWKDLEAEMASFLA